MINRELLLDRDKYHKYFHQQVECILILPN